MVYEDWRSSEMNFAKNFSLEDKNGKIHDLLSLKSKYKVIYFYPKDDTPGCTIEAKEFSELVNDFKKLQTEIIGISGGDNESKKKFCVKYNLNLLLLTDPNFSVSKSYGVYGAKSFMGKKYDGIKRTTFILDQENKIIRIFDEVKALGHAKEILNYIKDTST